MARHRPQRPDVISVDKTKKSAAIRGYSHISCHTYHKEPSALSSRLLRLALLIVSWLSFAAKIDRVTRLSALTF